MRNHNRSKTCKRILIGIIVIVIILIAQIFLSTLMKILKNGTDDAWLAPLPPISNAKRIEVESHVSLYE